MSNPLGALGDPAKLIKMRSQAKKMKKMLARESFEFEDGELRLVVSGDREIQEITIDGQDQKALVKLLNKSLKEVDLKVAQKMFASGGMEALLGGLK